MATWLEKVQQQYIIVTGDGAGYYPNWLNASFSVEYNVSQFNFRNLSGTLVDRQQPLGAVYNLEIIFQGDNHLDTAQAFRKSAGNKKPWTIQHPLYGKIYVQPISTLSFDNPQNRANTTTITGPVMETIGKSSITFVQSAPDVVNSSKTAADTAQAQAYVNNVPEPDVADTNAWTANVKGFYSGTVVNIISETDVASYINQYNYINADINNAVGFTAASITDVQTLISMPAYFADSIANRVNFISNEFNTLLAQVAGLSLPSLKSLWENNAGTCMSALCVAATFNIQATDYVYATDATAVIAIITGAYSSYLTSLDALQSVYGSEENGYMPDAQSLMLIDGMVNYTVASLLTIAANAKQQRIFTLTRDNNWIEIAYQLYGLADDDSTITQVMNDNNVCLNEILQALKGRQIIYYV